MKVCRFVYQNEIRWGVLEKERIGLLPDLFLDCSLNNNAAPEEYIRPAQIDLIPPVAPSKIVCVGRNYSAHAKELGNETPTEPLLFLKAPSAIVMDGQDILLPKQTEQVEHEGELGVVIGRECRKLAETDNPFEYILGYLCLNDVTARDLQKKDVQFTRAKSFDTFCPIGSFIKTELDVSDIRVTTRVNGEIKQDGRTSEMVFDVPFLVRYISNQMTLNTGDIIATGTPAGVSAFSNGDVCEVEIEGIGVLRNNIRK